MFPCQTGGLGLVRDRNNKTNANGVSGISTSKGAVQVISCPPLDENSFLMFSLKPAKIWGPHRRACLSKFKTHPFPESMGLERPPPPTTTNSSNRPADTATHSKTHPTTTESTKTAKIGLLDSHPRTAQNKIPLQRPRKLQRKAVARGSLTEYSE